MGRLLAIPLLVCCVLLVSAALSLGAEFKYREFKTHINISANRSSALLLLGEHRLGLSLGGDMGNPRECGGHKDVCVSWGDTGPTLLLRRQTSSPHSLWDLVLHGASTADVSVDLDGAALYGGPIGHRWPANTDPLTHSPYVTGAGSTGAVAERVWFTSSGLALKVEFGGHLFVSQTSSRLSLEFTNQVPYPTTNSTVRVKVCLGNNGRDAFACFPQKRRPTDREMISRPIWSTWVRYKADVSQDKVMTFADEIREHGFPISTMEIDDKWETCYGNHQWDTVKFPNPKAMVSELKSRGMYVTLWVHPFINTDCAFFKEAAPYLYRHDNGSVAVTTWWNGQAGLIDFTNKSAVEWFKARLSALRDEVGLTGFKFDAGEASYIPGLLDGTRVLPVPNLYTHEYAKMAASFGVMGETRCGADNTDTPIFQRLQDTDTHWEASKGGLRSVIPAVLNLNAVGYSAVLPDMVGGNLYTADITKELFIRWLQLNTFLPLIQFSIPPWQFDNETVEISRSLTWLHAQYADMFVKEMEESRLEDGHRVITPVWWHSPDDLTALNIDSEFLVGTNLLVAPVLEEGAVTRDIYLPSGVWADPTSSSSYVGPTTLKEYRAPLSCLPFFIRLSD